MLPCIANHSSTNSELFTLHNISRNLIAIPSHAFCFKLSHAWLTSKSVRKRISSLRLARGACRDGCAGAVRPARHWPTVGGAWPMHDVISDAFTARRRAGHALINRTELNDPLKTALTKEVCTVCQNPITYNRLMRHFTKFSSHHTIFTEERKYLIVIQNIRVLSYLPCVTIMLTQYWVSIKAMWGAWRERGISDHDFLERICPGRASASFVRILCEVNRRDGLSFHLIATWNARLLLIWLPPAVELYVQLLRFRLCSILMSISCIRAATFLWYIGLKSNCFLTSERRSIIS